tara:strand:+ start:2172 stop:3032 length:861 start_codon:yes stop_codon:yes gene_type:complete
MSIETVQESNDERHTVDENATSDDVSGDSEPSPENETSESENQAMDGESLLKLILKQQIEFYVDRTGRPSLTLPGDGLDRAFEIQSRRVSAYIATLAWNCGQMLLTTAELKRILRVLEGIAWDRAPRDASRDQIWNSLQEIPVLQVVIEFMRRREGETHETKMQPLLKELSELASQLKFDLYSKKWPKTAAHLSAQLRQEQHCGILEQCGISVEIKRDNTGANVILKRMKSRIPGDDDESSASPPASHTNSQTEDNLSSSDNGDGENQQDNLEALVRKRMSTNSKH